MFTVLTPDADLVNIATLYFTVLSFPNIFHESFLEKNCVVWS